MKITEYRYIYIIEELSTIFKIVLYSYNNTSMISSTGSREGAIRGMRADIKILYVNKIKGH